MARVSHGGVGCAEQALQAGLPVFGPEEFLNRDKRPILARWLLRICGSVFKNTVMASPVWLSLGYRPGLRTHLSYRSGLIWAVRELGWGFNHYTWESAYPLCINLQISHKEV